jgi:peptide/nickel transport system permease protein
MMGGFLLRKVGAALVVVFVASVLVFAGVRAIPGDTAMALAGGSGPDASLAGDAAHPAVLKAIRHQYFLDRPLPVQYGHWIWLVLHGNLGRDTRALPIRHTIVQRLPITLELATLSLALAILIGIPLGVLAATRPGRMTDHTARTAGLALHSVPHFWLGLLLIIWFAVDLHWLPASGYVSISHPVANLRHLVLPCIVLGTGFATVLMRQTRAEMLTALSADYVRTARAKGLTEWSVVCRHALRNSLITVTTLLALDLGALISGAAIVETIFGIPGYGALMIQAFGGRDYGMIQAVVLLTAVVFVLANLAADILYSVLDPRIRVVGARE